MSTALDVTTPEVPTRKRPPKPIKYTPGSERFPGPYRPRMAGAADVWARMRDRISGAPVEEFWILGLDVRHRVISEIMNARGSLTGVEIHPRDVFRPLVRDGIAAVIFVHNHPSGDPTPSRADIELTDRLRQIGDLLGIPVLDHVVIGAEGYVSIAERAR